MDVKVAEDTAAALEELDGRWLVIVGDEMHCVDGAEGAGRDKPVRLGDAGVEAPLEPDLHDGAGRGDEADDGVVVGEGEGDGLLAQDRLAEHDEFGEQAGVRIGRRGEDIAIDLLIEDRVEADGRCVELRGEIMRALRRPIRDDDVVGDRTEVLHPDGAHASCSDDRDPHAFVLSAVVRRMLVGEQHTRVALAVSGVVWHAPLERSNTSGEFIDD